MDKPEPLSDEEITAIWNRFIKQPYDGRTLSAIIAHTAQAVVARYEAQENHRARTVAKLVEDLASMAASRDQWKVFADSLIGAGERREAQIAQQRNIMMDEIERLRAERDALRADAQDWMLIEEDAPVDVPLDTPVLLAWWDEWSSEWKIEVNYAGSERGGWRHGRATHWKPQPRPPAARAAQEKPDA